MNDAAPNGADVLTGLFTLGWWCLMGPIVLASSIWVLFDAKRIGVKKGQLKGVCDMGPMGWFFACLGLWIIGFPAYLAHRDELKRINGKTIPTPTSVPPVPGSSQLPQDFEQELTKLARLKDSGILTEEEFSAKKRAILGLEPSSGSQPTKKI